MYVQMLFHGPSLTLVCFLGQLWGTLVPQGYNLQPTLGYVLTEFDGIFKCGDPHVSMKFCLSAMARQIWLQC